MLGFYRKLSKIKKDVFLSIFLACCFLISCDNYVYAQPEFVPRIPNPTRFNSAEDIINFASGLIVPAFLIGFGAMLFLGAATYLTAGDDKEKVKKARNTIIAAIIGFTLAVLAPTIMNFVAGILGVESGLSILGG